jgi:hypothetical protein
VSFVLKTSLGALDFGSRPTDDEGRVVLEIRDRRYGEFPVLVSYAGDGAHQPIQSETRVGFGPIPAATLPESGVLISPNFSPAIGLPFLFFYGSMWFVFAYCGYVIVVKMGRLRRASSPSTVRMPIE